MTPCTDEAVLDLEQQVGRLKEENKDLEERLEHCQLENFRLTERHQEPRQDHQNFNSNDSATASLDSTIQNHETPIDYSGDQHVTDGYPQVTNTQENPNRELSRLRNEVQRLAEENRRLHRALRNRLQSTDLGARILEVSRLPNDSPSNAPSRLMTAFERIRAANRRRLNEAAALRQQQPAMATSAAAVVRAQPTTSNSTSTSTSTTNTNTAAVAAINQDVEKVRADFSQRAENTRARRQMYQELEGSIWKDIFFASLPVLCCLLLAMFLGAIQVSAEQ
ncbi:hypothetical protein CTRI78_v010623 [Colletotrichum trifolii]|uniref:Uncharacterized protein n=1 Tax=Colletotrichum trifolii TaxID=5466 RepID=A0A4R8QWR2_COLTR|nr:hypothetical protein CTRI78_v010623 [Colletotrichum trifolii]